MRYLLDTDICIYINEHRPAHVRDRFDELKPGDVGMSVVTYLELVYGALKSGRPESNLAITEALRERIPAQPLSENVARHYGRLRTELERAGTPIGTFDLVIASHALTLGLILVTNNTREFSRVKGLKLENWAG
jgi:tRNA(fMet)-specific endonuclease VapC